MINAAASVVASIPSPSISYFDLGPLRIHFYALCIIAGIIVAVLLTNRRLTKRGAEPWVVIDISLLAVPLAIIGARIYHVVTHWDFYFGEGANPLSALFIWEGGIAIYGALIGGAIGAWLGCRWTGIRFWTFADALAPGLLLAQAIGRFGNWFNQELFGLPTDLPWGLEIDSDNPAFPPGLGRGHALPPDVPVRGASGTASACSCCCGRAAGSGCSGGACSRLYLIWYSAGRIVWESIRIDQSEIILGLRTNVWAAIFGVDPRHRDLLRAEAPAPRTRAVALRARPRVEARQALYNRRTPTTSSTSANPRRPKPSRTPPQAQSPPK